MKELQRTRQHVLATKQQLKQQGNSPRKGQTTGTTEEQKHKKQRKKNAAAARLRNHTIKWAPFPFI
jgi:hypothetical protein